MPSRVSVVRASTAAALRRSRFDKLPDFLRSPGAFVKAARRSPFFVLAILTFRMFRTSPRNDSSAYSQAGGKVGFGKFGVLLLRAGASLTDRSKRECLLERRALF